MRAGVVESADVNARAIRQDIPDAAAKFLARRPLLVVGGLDGAGRAWASLLTGPPGFITVPDGRRVSVAATPPAGDPLSGLGRGEAVGLLAIEPETRRRMRVNGTISGDRAGYVVEVEQVVSNCPKYISERHHHFDPHPAPAHPARRAPGLDERQRRWIAASDTFFLATTDGAGGADVSHRGGNPGFVEVLDDERLVWPDYSGNAMFLSLGNLEVDSRAGLLFIDWELGSTLQLTGTARTDWSPSARRPGAERMVIFESAEVVEIEAATSLRWRFQGYSRFNPPAPAPL